MGDATIRRVHAEFLEMPGLCVTPQQAQRLWGLEPEVCHRVLEHLVDTGFLRRTPQGMYLRSTEGPPVPPIESKSSESSPGGS